MQRKDLLSTKVAIHIAVFQSKTTLEDQIYLLCKPTIFPIADFKKSSAHPTEKSFRITHSILSMTLLLHCSALRVSRVILFVNLEIITATLNKEEASVKEKWQHNACKNKPGTSVCLCYLRWPLKADVNMTRRGFRFTLSFWIGLA